MYRSTILFRFISSVCLGN